MHEAPTDRELTDCTAMRPWSFRSDDRVLLHPGHAGATLRWTRRRAVSPAADLCVPPPRRRRGPAALPRAVDAVPDRSILAEMAPCRLKKAGMSPRQRAPHGNRRRHRAQRNAHAHMTRYGKDDHGILLRSHQQRATARDSRWKCIRHFVFDGPRAWRGGARPSSGASGLRYRTRR